MKVIKKCLVKSISIVKVKGYRQTHTRTHTITNEIILLYYECVKPIIEWLCKTSDSENYNTLSHLTGVRILDLWPLSLWFLYSRFREESCPLHALTLKTVSLQLVNAAPSLTSGNFNMFKVKFRTTCIQNVVVINFLTTGLSPVHTISSNNWDSNA